MTRAGVSTAPNATGKPQRSLRPARAANTRNDA